MLTEKQSKIVSEINDLRKEFNNSAGKKAQRQINKFEVAFNIYSGNKNEVLKLIEKVEDEEYAIKLFSAKTSETRSEVLFEFIRLFHNYVHSISFLINITRNLMGKYYTDSKLYVKYQSKIDSIFKENLIAKFLKELRNYFEHDQIPYFNQQLKFSRESENYSGFQLFRDKLLEKDNWSKSSRDFLEESEKRIDISSLIKDYNRSINLLYDWLFEELDKRHRNDIEEMKQLKKNIRKLKSKVDFAVL